jgi:hypothetical protein
VRQELLGCWAHLDPVDTIVGLRNTIRLFSDLASRTAAALGFHPFDHARVHAEIEAILAQHSSQV